MGGYNTCNICIYNQNSDTQFYEKEKVMKKRKLLPILLALAMVLTMIPAAVFAESSPVEAEDQATLISAINAAKDGTVIKLTDDIALDAPLPGAAISGKDITIDGNYKTISFDQSSTNNALFGNNTNPLYAGTKLTVNNLTVKNIGAQGGYASITGYNANGSVISYSGCTFENLYAAVYVNPITTNPENGGVNLSIKGCSYTGTKYAYAIDEISEGYLLTKVTFEDNDGEFTESEPVKDTVYAKVGGITKAFKTIQAAVDEADGGSVITVAPGTYDEAVIFKGKSVTVKAQYPAYANGEKTDADKVSKFTGTFNTYNGTDAASFNDDQSIVVNGFALSGDGLKVGNTNYNGVGNLTVKNCTMEFGNNLSNSDDNPYAALNYFVKTSGNNDGKYANVTVENNLIEGKPAANIYPIQLWDVKNAVVKDNVMKLENAEDRQAIGVSKMSKNAVVEISGNVIEGAGGGIYVTTWMLDGTTEDGEIIFDGKINISDNALTGAGKGEMEPIFVGYEDVEGQAYGILGGLLTERNNTNNGEPVAAVIGEKVGSDVERIVATFKDGDVVVCEITTILNEDGKATITTPAAPVKEGTAFLGWGFGEELYDENTQLIIGESVTFQAMWQGEGQTGGTTAEPEAKPDSSAKTGDDFNMAIPFAAAGIALAALAAVVATRKRHN